MYREAPPDLDKKVAAAGVAGTPRVYAEDGLWYDALSATWNPGKKADEKSLREQRVALLKQVGFGVSGSGKSKEAVAAEDELLEFLRK